MDQSQGFSTQKQPDTQEYILYDSMGVYMKFCKRVNLICSDEVKEISGSCGSGGRLTTKGQWALSVVMEVVYVLIAGLKWVQFEVSM